MSIKKEVKNKYLEFLLKQRKKKEFIKFCKTKKENIMKQEELKMLENLL